MYAIEKTYDFAASHVLDGLPEGHQCGRLHGHNYRVTIRLTAVDVDAVGMVYDFGRLAPVKEFINDHFDHRHLNDNMVLNPTAENLARIMWDVVQIACPDLPKGGTLGVSVAETPTSVGEFYGTLT